MKLRVGINSGPVVAGVIGKSKYIYDLWGDTVNLAARLEQLTKETGAQLLVSDAMRDATAIEGAVDLGPMKIRGYESPIRVWRLA